MRDHCEGRGYTLASRAYRRADGLNLSLDARRRDTTVVDPTSVTCLDLDIAFTDFCTTLRTLPLKRMTLSTQPQVRRDYPLILSISISGRKETYKDSPCNSERIGKSPA
uniref:Uncharacterized protein n=1 Tax=Cucumis melo TaxID=3656 RepID=A0A9I9E1P8_CUCME